MDHFGLIVEFQVRPEHLQRFNQLLAVNARTSLTSEAGCRQFDVLEAEDDPSRVILYEVYDDAAAFATHLAASHTQAFLAVARELVTSQSVVRLRRTLAPVK